jgi:hypothetical protein
MLESNGNSRCHGLPVTGWNPETMRTTSMMDDCNASALTPARKSSIAVLSSRLKKQQLAATGRGELFLFDGQMFAMETSIEIAEFN